MVSYKELWDFKVFVVVENWSTNKEGEFKFV